MMDAMKIEELADNIWRVRMARDGRWPESAMNRYGVIADMPVRAVRESLDFDLFDMPVKRRGGFASTCELRNARARVEVGNEENRVHLPLLYHYMLFYRNRKVRFWFVFLCGLGCRHSLTFAILLSS